MDDQPTSAALAQPEPGGVRPRLVPRPVEPAALAAAIPDAEFPTTLPLVAARATAGALPAADKSPAQVFLDRLLACRDSLNGSLGELGRLHKTITGKQAPADEAGEPAMLAGPRQAPEFNEFFPAIEALLADYERLARAHRDAVARLSAQF